MTKSALVSALARRMGWPKTRAEEVINHLLEDTGLIADALASGDKVTVPGFGTFEAVPVAARAGRNPQTGEAIQIPAHRRVLFRAGSGLKDRLNP